MCVYVYTAGLVCTGGASLPQITPSPEPPEEQPRPDNFNTTSDSDHGLGLRRLAPKELYGALERFSFRVTGPSASPGRGSPPDPAAWGSRGVPDPSGRHSQLAPFAPLKSPLRELRTVRRGRMTHVSSKCCSKVASIPPAVHSSARPRSESLPSPPPASGAPGSHDAAGRRPGRRRQRAKLRGATSALCALSKRSLPPMVQAGPRCRCPSGDR